MNTTQPTTRPLVLVALALLVFAGSACSNLTTVDYPRAPQRGEALQRALPDPYRWLEDARSPETRRWIRAENAITRRHLDALPGRAHLTRRLALLARSTAPGEAEDGRALRDRVDAQGEARAVKHGDEVTGGPVITRYRVRDEAKLDVPVLVIQPPGLARDGSHPTLLHVHRGEEATLTPRLSPAIALWLELGGVYVLVDLGAEGARGASQAALASLLASERALEGVAAVARWLADEGYTSARRLALHGAADNSHLISACLTRKPWLFGAAVLDVGDAGGSRAGLPSGEEGALAGAARSPLELTYRDVRGGTAYPATLITTSLREARDAAARSFKFGAALQEAQAGEATILVAIEGTGGVVGGEPASRQRALVDRYLFVLDALGVSLPDGLAVPEDAAPVATTRAERARRRAGAGR